MASNTSLLDSEMFLVFIALLQAVYNYIHKDVNVSFHCLLSDKFLMSDRPLPIRLPRTDRRTQ